MILEGVFAGNQGPLFYDGNEISKSVASWNHKPLTVGHPQIAGQYVSGCLPETIDQYSVGMVLNTKWNKTRKKLVAEAWFEETRLDIVPGGHRIKEALTKQEPMEVSTGLFVDNELASGSYEGREYRGRARNFRPDHLAMIVSGVGACSVKDGAGLLVNRDQTTSENFTSADEQGKLLGNRIQVVREEKPLIVNEKAQMKREEIAGILGDEHKDFVANLSDAQVEALGKLQIVQTVEVEKIVEKPVVNEAPKNLEELLAVVPADVKAKIDEAFAINAAHRDGLINRIVANEKNQFTADELAGMATAQLEKLSVLAVNAAPVAPAATPVYAGSAPASAPAAPAVKGFRPPSTFASKDN